MEERPKLLVVDGMALLFRAFYATSVTNQFMVNKKGIPTNGVQGLMRHLFAAIRQNNPTHVVICWDMGEKTFRSDLFTGYKTARKKPPEEMIPQFDLAKEVTRAFGFINVGVLGFEADDCIGTISVAARDHFNTTILSGDKDLLQLISPSNEVWIMQKGHGNYKRYNQAVFWEEMGIRPDQLVDVKALMGDPSDGYPGVPGIGEKTALKLICQFGTIEGVLQHLDQLMPAQRKKIQENLEMLRVSRKLAAICTEVPIELNLKRCMYSGMQTDAIEIMEEYGLYTLKRDLLVRRESSSF